ncbi:hypothetical protein DSM104443_03548 [Usitatibacter rugosus]|uniref:Uncharacterized protein n=1 Tax=Usitatibacter rugosus TaxID=2732067 RepID=A0A6M4GZJ5_9PROT|nr:hypothetical protein [Usitatibacter rugosus]QJR12462.1 hypothetical protein DSM104443_03548 [Usitatibacter rugosus]
MIEILLGAVNEVGLLGGVLIVIVVLTAIARLHPLLSLLMGLALLAVPLVQVATFERRFFYSDGSAAGLVVFLFYAGFGLFCGMLGFAFAADGVRRFAKGEGKRTFTRRGIAIAAGVVGVVLLGVMAWRYQPHVLPSAKTATTRDDRDIRKVKVTTHYDLAWDSRGGASKLALRIPAADIELPPGEREPIVGETRDGPAVLRLALPGADAPYASLTLHRDDSTVDNELLERLRKIPKAVDPALVDSLWVDTSQSGWKLLGLNCGPETAKKHPAVTCYAPEAPLARHFPGLFGFARVRLLTEGDRGNRRCDMTFTYRDRIASVSARAECFTAGSLSALTAAASLLDRLGRDADSPPDAASRIARATSAVASCEQRAKSSWDAMQKGGGATAADMERAAGTRCDAALQQAAAELEATPAAATPLMLRAMEAHRDAGGARSQQHVQAILKSLEARGQGESPEALRAHALRVARIGGTTDPKLRAEARPSIDFLLATSPRVLAPDDPVFEKIGAALPSLSDDADYQARKLGWLRAWQEKAAAAAPGSDVALKALYRLCLQRLYANLEREALGLCAYNLFGTWQERAAKGLGFEPFGSEIELANSVSTMHSVYAYVSEDFRGGLVALHRVHAFAAQRFPAGPEDLFNQFRQREIEVATKIQNAPLKLPPRR